MFLNLMLCLVLSLKTRIIFISLFRSSISRALDRCWERRRSHSVVGASVATCLSAVPAPSGRPVCLGWLALCTLRMTGVSGTPALHLERGSLRRFALFLPNTSISAQSTPRSIDFLLPSPSSIDLGHPMAPLLFSVLALRLGENSDFQPHNDLRGYSAGGIVSVLGPICSNLYRGAMMQTLLGNFGMARIVS